MGHNNRYHTRQWRSTHSNWIFTLQPSVQFPAPISCYHLACTPRSRENTEKGS
jgi:hypothetical protein